jgi:hypothetical protein
VLLLLFLFAEQQHWVAQTLLKFKCQLKLDWHLNLHIIPYKNSLTTFERCLGVQNVDLSLNIANVRILVWIFPYPPHPPPEIQIRLNESKKNTGSFFPRNKYVHCLCTSGLGCTNVWFLFVYLHLFCVCCYFCFWYLDELWDHAVCCLIKESIIKEKINNSEWINLTQEHLKIPKRYSETVVFENCLKD